MDAPSFPNRVYPPGVLAPSRTVDDVHYVRRHDRVLPSQSPRRADRGVTDRRSARSGCSPRAAAFIRGASEPADASLAAALLQADEGR